MMNIQAKILASVISVASVFPAAATSLGDATGGGVSDYDWYLGLTLGLELNQYRLNSTTNDNQSVAKYGVLGGVYWNENNRTYIAYSLNGSGRAIQNDFEFYYNYLLGLGDWLGMDENNLFTWYVGPGIGFDVFSPQRGNLPTDTGFIFGVQTGFNFQFNEHWSTEIGYKYTRRNNNSIRGASSLKLQNSNQWYLGANYHF